MSLPLVPLGGAQYFLDNIVMNYELPGTGVTKIDFEKDELGTSYPMTNGNSSVVENDPEGSGKVLHAQLLPLAQIFILNSQ